MAKIKDAMLEEQAKNERQFGEDMKMFKLEHEAGQHKDGIVPFCELCEEEREKQPFCEDCNDTGIIEIMGGSDADEWGVVDKKPCVCRQS